MKRALSLTAALLMSGCTLGPAYQRPAPPVPAAWPRGPAYAAPAPAETPADWRAVFADPKLAAIIETALANNRDLRTAAANIETARGQFQVQRGALLPTVSAGVSGVQSRSLQGPAVLEQRGYTASVGVSAYELDVFGRVRSLSGAALQRYLASEETQRSVRISLIAETASDYLAVAAQRSLLRIAQASLESGRQSLDLNRARFSAGAASELEVRQAEQIVDQARADVARFTAQAAQAVNALTLVAGAPIDEALLPAELDALAVPSVEVGAGLSSQVLLDRPDVAAAERQLIAANANIGAARAAFFPRITLTGSQGTSAPTLNDLFGNGTGVWSFAPSVSLPLFAGGQNLGGLRVARGQREAAVAAYERAIQVAFREVADALAVRGTIDEQLAAQTALSEAAAAGFTLSSARFERGADSYLAALIAQRTLYGAQQARINVQLARGQNLVTLYRVLGGALGDRADRPSP